MALKFCISLISYYKSYRRTARPLDGGGLSPYSAYKKMTPADDQESEHLRLFRFTNIQEPAGNRRTFAPDPSNHDCRHYEQLEAGRSLPGTVGVLYPNRRTFAPRPSDFCTPNRRSFVPRTVGV